MSTMAQKVVLGHDTDTGPPGAGVSMDTGVDHDAPSYVSTSPSVVTATQTLLVAHETEGK
jgi:hypothetical protein